MLFHDAHRFVNSTGRSYSSSKAGYTGKETNSDACSFYVDYNRSDFVFENDYKLMSITETSCRSCVLYFGANLTSH